MEDDGHEVNSKEDVRRKSDVNSSETERDETWVMVGLSRRSCSHPVEIFGSNIRNHNTMTLTIKKASRSRQHGSDYYHGHERLIEVEMTPVQFAQMITSANWGDGVPCSLRELNGKHFEYKTGRDMGDTIKSDMRNEFVEVSDRCKLIEAQVQSILKRPGRVSAIEKDEISDNLMHLVQDIRSNIPFMEQQFKKTMAKAVLEAKQEVTTHVEMAITQIGMNKLELNELGIGVPKTPELMVGAVDVPQPPAPPENILVTETSRDRNTDLSGEPDKPEDD